jgi:hypothetical protein
MVGITLHIDGPVLPFLGRVNQKSAPHCAIAAHGRGFFCPTKFQKLRPGQRRFEADAQTSKRHDCPGQCRKLEERSSFHFSSFDYRYKPESKLFKGHTHRFANCDNMSMYMPMPEGKKVAFAYHSMCDTATNFHKKTKNINILCQQ